MGMEMGCLGIQVSVYFCFLFCFLFYFILVGG